MPDTFLTMFHVLVHLTFTKNEVGAIIIPILQTGTERLGDLSRVSLVVMVKPVLKLRYLAPGPYT